MIIGNIQQTSISLTHFATGDLSLFFLKLPNRSQNPGIWQMASGFSLGGLAKSMRSPNEKLRSLSPPIPYRCRSLNLWCGPGTQFFPSAIFSENIFNLPQAVNLTLSPPGTSLTSYFAGGLCSVWNSAYASERCLMKLRSQTFQPSPKVLPRDFRRVCSSCPSKLQRSGAGFSLALRSTTSEMGLRWPLPKVQLLAGLSEEEILGQSISEQGVGLSRKRSCLEKLYLCETWRQVEEDWFHLGSSLGSGRWAQLWRADEPGRPSGEK